jgi:transcriptional regulator with XRE-family HTH domain
MPGRHQDLKRALRSARSQQGFKSDQALALAAGVHLQTLQNWMYGKTTPRPSELSKVAAVLEKPLDYFMAIYEGRDPEPPPLMQRLEELTAAVRDLVVEIREDREQAQGEARGRAAAEALRLFEDSGSHTTPRAPRGTRG